jgi:K+-sensing histidine kinase KdpD
MVGFKDFLRYSYPTAGPLASIISVTEVLKKMQYIVIADQVNPCYGILTSNDLLEHPHKLVIDCMTEKEIIQMDDSFEVVLGKFKQTQSEVLPVYHDMEFIGILEKTNLLVEFKDIIEKIQIKTSDFPDLKTSLLHNLYHEIRTPLNHVLGFMNVLNEMNQDDLNLNAIKYQQIVQTGSRNFLRFMNNLVELSLLESGENLSICVEPLFPEKVLIDLTAQFDEEKEVDSEMKIRYQKPDFDKTIITDYNRLKQVLSQLLDFSIHHSKTCSSILIGCEFFPDQDHIRFFIKNETAIINEGKSKIIIEGCQGLSHHDEPELSSFGMEVVKKITELIKGKFEVEIDDFGKITAYVTIPVTLSDAETENQI